MLRTLSETPTLASPNRPEGSMTLMGLTLAYRYLCSVIGSNMVPGKASIVRNRPKAGS